MEKYKYLDVEHIEIYLAVARLYHACTTDDGRCAVIADYIRHLLNAAAAAVSVEQQQAAEAE